MPSPESQNGDVTVIFRKGESLIIPPFSLPREARLDTETYEGTMHRLCEDNGVFGQVDYSISTEGLDDTLSMAYLAKVQKDEFEQSEFLIHRDEVKTHLHNHPYLSEAEKGLVSRALWLIR